VTLNSATCDQSRVTSIAIETTHRGFKYVINFPHRRTSSYCNWKDYFSQLHLAYRKWDSTETALLEVLDSIYTAANVKKS